MIEPFSALQVREGADGQRIVSYGTSSYGYDVRCADEFKIFTNINASIVDPKAFDQGSFVDFKGPVCIIPPNSFALARTMEYFRIPRSVLTICLGKSTYARCGIIVNVTPLEPEWRATSPSNFRIPRPYRRGFTQARAAHKWSFSNQMRFAAPVMRIEAASIKGSKA